MFRRTFFFIICILSAFSSSYLYSKTLTFRNQYGSLLEFSIGENNKISGYFTTAVATKSCPQTIGRKRPITGSIVGNAIAFTVAYPMCNSVLSIAGNLDKNEQMIDTVSILNHQAEDINYKPGFRLLGHGTYHKI